MATIILTTGVPGSGKTYVRCARFLVDDFLLNCDGVHWSNFPLRRDEIVEAVVRRANFARRGVLAKITAPFRRKDRHVCAQDIASRIQTIPELVLQAWKNEESGPWEFFQGVDLTDAHIAIDEIHNYVTWNKSAKYIQLWIDFLAEIRHRGCTFEGLTQDFDQVHQALKGRAAIQLELIPCEDMRDPFFHIMMIDWYNLKAGFTGEFHKTVVEVESRKSKDSFKENNRRRFLITPDYFKFYDSYNKSLQEIEAEKAELEAERQRVAALHLQGDAAKVEEKRLAALGKVISAEEAEASFQEDASAKKSSRAPKYEFQRRTRLSLLSWFILKNFLTLFWRLVLVAVLSWLCFFGGMNTVIMHFMMVTQRIAHSNGAKSPASSSPSPGKVAASSSSPARSSAVFLGKGGFPQGQGGGLTASDSVDSGSVHEVEQLKKSVEAKDKAISELQKEVEKLKDERKKGFRPVFFGVDEAQLSNGLRIKVGYEFEKGSGDYEGRKVSFIDPRSRAYQLDDGKWVRMWGN